jgi:flagellar L-ring protein FlgH
MTASLSSLVRTAACLAGAGMLLAGCATNMAATPPVDILPTAQPTLPYPSAPPAAGPANFEDRRARLVGDHVTVQIVENVSASQKSSSTTDRTSSVDSAVTAFPFLKAAALDKVSVGGNSANKFEGKGGTESTNTFTGAITATVVAVMPNGHLVIAGEKQIGVNQNVDVLRFSGTVDPRALQPGSVISSQQVANVRVESRGRGQQAEAQANGWLSRFFSTVTPF